MVLLLEELVVEFVAIAATLTALACLVYLLVLCVLERRELRLQSASHVREWATSPPSAPQRQSREPVGASRTPAVQARG